VKSQHSDHVLATNSARSRSCLCFILLLAVPQSPSESIASNRNGENIMVETDDSLSLKISYSVQPSWLASYSQDVGGQTSFSLQGLPVPAGPVAARAPFWQETERVHERCR
jgi:hypothetical protein